MQIESDDIVAGFREMIEMVRMQQPLSKRDQFFLTYFSKDTTSFFVWIESRKLELNHLFKEHIFKTWENAVQQENRHAQEMLKDHHMKRTTKLRRLQKREMYEDGLMREYIIKTSAWSSSIQVKKMMGMAMRSRGYIIHHPLSTLGRGNGTVYQGITR